MIIAVCFTLEEKLPPNPNSSFQNKRIFFRWEFESTLPAQQLQDRGAELLSKLMDDIVTHSTPKEVI